MGFVSANQVTIGYAAASREDALHYLSEQAVELGFADDASAVEAAFIARENEAETGLVAGFAVPHAKSDAIHTPGVAVLKLSEPVEWLRSINRSFSKEKGRDAIGVAALSAFPQIKPAKINLSLFGR